MRTPPFIRTAAGVPVPATPQGCTAFPADRYPAGWRLHVVVELDGRRTHAHTSGDEVAYVNAYAMAGQERDGDVFAWVDDGDDAALARVA